MKGRIPAIVAALALAGCVTVGPGGQIRGEFREVAQRPRNVLMIDLAALADDSWEHTPVGPMLELIYEQAATNGNSWGAMVGYAALEMGSESMSVTMVIPLLKGYPGQTAPQGGFYMVGLGFTSVSYRDSVAPSNDVDLTALSYLAGGGYKWLSGNFAFEVGFGVRTVAVFGGAFYAGLFLELAVGVAF